MSPLAKTILHTAAASDSTFLAAVKTYLRIDGDDDAVVASLIKAATERLEKEINVKFLNQKYDIYFDSFPTRMKDEWWDGSRDGALSSLIENTGTMELPFGPCTAITAIKTFDQADVATTLSSSAYQLDSVSHTPRVAVRSGYTWPTTILRPMNGVKFEEATFGFGAAYANIPDALSTAVKIYVAYLYENRGDAEKQNAIPNTALMLIAPYGRAKI